MEFNGQLTMHILIASDHYPPFIGGAHRQTQILSQELSKRGHEVQVATVWQPGLPYLEQDGGVQVYRLKQLRTLFTPDVADPVQRHQPPFPDPVTVRQLRRLFKELQPGVIHSHGWFSFSCAEALQEMDIPLLISGRDYGYSCATRTLLYHDQLCTGPALVKCLGCAAGFYGASKGALAASSLFASRPLLRSKISGIHSISSFVQEIIERDLFGDHRSELESAGGPILESIIPSFLLDQDDTPVDPAFLERLPEEPYILFVGGLQPRKGLDTLLTAYQRLASPPPLVLIGYTTQGMAENFSHGVSVLLDISHANVMQAWRKCLMGVIPSVWPEPLGMVVVEAMSAGRPVIASRIGGITDTITDEQTGLLVPPADPAALASAMQRLIDEPVLRERLGRAALKQAGIYSAKNVIPQFERLYLRLIQAEKSRHKAENKSYVSGLE